MAADTKICSAAAIAACDAITALVDVDAGALVGKLIIYDGVAPATADTALSSNDPLVTFDLVNATPFAAAIDSGGYAEAVLDCTPALSASGGAVVSGTASFFRILSTAGDCIVQGTCGTADADMIMNTLTIVGGSTVTLTSYSLKVSEG